MDGAFAAVQHAAQRGKPEHEIGLPLTLLPIRPEHKQVVLEMGTYARGRNRAAVRAARTCGGRGDERWPGYWNVLAALKGLRGPRLNWSEALGARWGGDFEL